MKGASTTSSSHFLYDGIRSREVNLYCTHGRRQIGRIFSRFISRSKIGKDFNGGIDEPSEDCTDLAFTVFDPQGRLETQWYKVPVPKRSGLWSNAQFPGHLSMNYANLVIKTEAVEMEYRKKRIGKVMVEAVLREMVARVVRIY